MRQAFRQHLILKYGSDLIVAGLIILILIPPTMTVLMSLNDGAFIRFPIKALSLRWYGEFLARDEWIRAAVNSLEIASAVSLLSTAAGVLAAYAYARSTFPGREASYLFITLPLYVPGSVLGLGVAVMFGGAGLWGYTLYGAKILVVAAHCMWALPLVFMIMVATFRNLDTSIIDAAADLGSPPATTFFHVTLPFVRTGVVSSAILAFVISLNEFPMALFLTDGDSRTLPVLMWMSLRSAATPVLAVAAVVLLVIVVMGIGLVAWLFARREEKQW